MIRSRFWTLGALPAIDHARPRVGSSGVDQGDARRLPAGVQSAPADLFQTIRLYKRDGIIRFMVDDVIAVVYDDDGNTHVKWLTPSAANTTT